MYKAHQLPFNEYRETVKELKRKLDREAKSIYPMVARVTDQTTLQVLSEELFKNVWDRDPDFKKLAENDWDAPVTVAFYNGDDFLGLDMLETVTVRSVENFAVQLNYFESEEK